MDAQKKIVDTRFLDFETPEGRNRNGFHRVGLSTRGCRNLRDYCFILQAIRQRRRPAKTYQKEGEIKVPVIHKQG